MFSETTMFYSDKNVADPSLWIIVNIKHSRSSPHPGWFWLWILPKDSCKRSGSSTHGHMSGSLVLCKVHHTKWCKKHVLFELPDRFGHFSEVTTKAKSPYISLPPECQAPRHYSIVSQEAYGKMEQHVMNINKQSMNKINQIKSDEVNQIQSNQIKSNQIKSNQVKSINQSINPSINQSINQFRCMKRNLSLAAKVSLCFLEFSYQNMLFFWHVCRFI